MGNNSFGYPLLVVMAVGVLTYACWRFWEGITGQGSDDAFGPYKNFFRYRLSPCVSVSPASVHDAPRMPCWVSSLRSVGSTAAVCNNPICNHQLQFLCVAAADSTTQLMGSIGRCTDTTLAIQPKNNSQESCFRQPLHMQMASNQGADEPQPSSCTVICNAMSHNKVYLT